MSRSVSEGSLKEARREQQVEEGPLAHGHPSKRARKGAGAFEEVKSASVTGAGYGSRGRQGVAPPLLDLGDASTASTSSVRNARPPTSTTHQFARIFSPYTYPSSASPAAPTFPPSPSTFTPSHDSHAGPQRIRASHQRRRGTSLPPPPRQSQESAHRHPSSPLAHRPSPIPDHRRKEKIYEARRASITHESPTLSQGDLVAYHASRALQLGGKRISPAPTALSPPITRSTLRELDLSEILRNPQLRHDSVFDPNLMFRPNYDGER